MNIKLYFILYIIYSFIGWVIEVIATSKDNKGFVNRGFLIGPYCPIYGTCALLMILILPNQENIFLLFLMSLLICSISEYLTSYVMEKLFKARWWDYSSRRFNLNGRICLKISLGFGLLGVILVRYVNPFITSYLIKIPNNIVDIIFYILIIIFAIDNIISFKVVLKIKETTKFIKMDNTREITEKVKAILGNSFLVKRLLKAFPDFRVIIKDLERKIRGKK
ncbi:MAG: putative ABC transporter permease [Firmicutes bacterium]|nr:putative ABC transporter permease [Bacillota bacterium]